jgi:hypothetical protein
MWNIAFAIWMEKNKPEMQDIPTRKLIGDMSRGKNQKNC